MINLLCAVAIIISGGVAFNSVAQVIIQGNDAQKENAGIWLILYLIAASTLHAISLTLRN